MSGNLLKRHTSGPVSNVGTYVEACHTLDPTTIRSEYETRVASAPTRSQPYIVEHDVSGRSEESTRLEELLAHRMFLSQTSLMVTHWSPVRIVDFQTPLNSKRSDGLGEVDLLGAGEGLCVIELKVLRRDGGADTPLNALMEVVGYCTVVDANQGRIASELRDIGHRVGTGPLSALVLAPHNYWARWDRTRTDEPWRAALKSASDVVGEATGLRVRFGSFDVSKVSATLDVRNPLV